jgi:hypothetical protein
MAMTQKEIEESIKKVSVLHGEIADLQNINFVIKETPDGNFLMMVGNRMFGNRESGVKVPATLLKAELDTLVEDANARIASSVELFIKARKDDIKVILATLETEMGNGVS